jgi:Lipid A 3-O-deacylase (PagL)
MKQFNTFLFILAIIPFLYAQTPAWEVQTNIHASTVLRHTSKINIGSGTLIPGAEIGVFKNATGKSAWQRYYHKPHYGASIVWFWPGARTHGHAIGFCPSFTLPFRTNEHHGWSFRLGGGVGIVTKPYDFQTNPVQNAIGTRWNNITQLRFAYRYNTEKLRLQTGFSFTHFSNGGIKQPNFGINMPSVFLSTAFGRKGNLPKDTPETKPSQPKQLRSIGIATQSWYTQVGYHILLDGPKYPIYGANLAVYYRMHRFNRFFMGVDAERNQAVYAWHYHAAGGADAEKIRKGADRRGFFIANEWLVGQVGLYIQMSRYVGNSYNAWTLGNSYNKLAVKYYVPVGSKSAIRPNVAIQMKAHKVAAEFIAVSVGVEY